MTGKKITIEISDKEKELKPGRTWRVSKYRKKHFAKYCKKLLNEAKLLGGHSLGFFKSLFFVIVYGFIVLGDSVLIFKRYNKIESVDKNKKNILDEGW